MIVVAAICIGVGFILNYSSRSYKMDAEVLEHATLVKDLKGLEEFLEKKPLSRNVVVYGTVGSTSTIENNRSDALGVFVEETASLRFEKMTAVGLVPDYRRILVKRKEVPWYLDDGTARVYVMGAQYAKGFYDTLKKCFFTEPVTKHFQSLLSTKEIHIPADRNYCECCEQVLEIGTALTVVGIAERDRDGVPVIRVTYQIFKGCRELNALVSDLESNSVFSWNFSLFLTAMGVVLLAVSVLQDMDE